MTTKCFFLEDTGRVQVTLRRYNWDEECKCPDKHGYHNSSSAPIGEEPFGEACGDNHPHDNKRWPKKCPCGYEFKEEDQWQANRERLWIRKDTGAIMILHDTPAGAMWYAPWYSDNFKGPDGNTLVVKLPGGHNWIVDSIASNCTKPKDKTHRCWVRTGTPPNVTAGKGGNTCSAGAGSIMVPGYHGFLKDGVLT